MARKDFDAERQQRAATTAEDREFVLGGQTFHARAEVQPEVLERFESISEDMKLPDVLEIVDETILSLIEDAPDAGHERYTAVRANTADPVGTETLVELAQWLVEVQTGRPTVQPAPSPESDETAGTSLTDASSSEETPPEQPA